MNGDHINNIEFPIWFEEKVSLHMERNSPETEELLMLARGPDMMVLRYKGYIVNGFRFHTKEREIHRKTHNSGVLVHGELPTANLDYYRILVDIVELRYIGGNRVTLFKCGWWDVHNK